MKVIFLDIDGVMITNLSSKRGFNPTCVENLNQIIQQTGASIVVSSTYRQMGFSLLKEWFKANGIEEGLIGITPITSYRTRGEEIKQYIEEAQLDPSLTVDQFVIIDDYDDMSDLLPYLIQTDGKIGLDSNTRDKAIQMLL